MEPQHHLKPEIKKQLTPDRCAISRICGCYVDGEKNIITSFRDTFLALPEEEIFKYFEIFRKTLSGTVGKNLLNYDSLLALTHFKGHMMGGFGGSNKNLGIGCADGRIGKGEIHTRKGSLNMWSIAEEELMERITESTWATVSHFSPKIAFINVLRNMSVDCDCAGTGAER